jgi:hypothetical protein
MPRTNAENCQPSFCSSSLAGFLTDPEPFFSMGHIKTRAELGSETPKCGLFTSCQNGAVENQAVKSVRRATSASFAEVER